jgi:octaprenyl-diphosphate synthase
VSIPDFLKPIAADMQALDNTIRQRLSSDVALINTVGEYIISAGGKRMRPALTLLTAHALDSAQKHEQAITLAAVVEFIHTATLLHDDVVDESSLRRGRETANALFGNAASVLVGDFLYSRAFQMMTDLGNMTVLRILANATNIIAEGEVLQLMNMHDPNTTQDAYLRVIRYKTAKLFEAAAELGAVSVGTDTPIQTQAATFGQAIGTAFQLVDDALDYAGDTSALGKNVGDDLREGKPTLPLIVGMERGTPEQRAMIVTAIEQGDVTHVEHIVSALKSCGAIEATYEAARQEAARAAAAIHAWPDNAAKTALIKLTQYVVERLN